MQRSKSQLNAIYYAYRGRAERRRLAKIGLDWKMFNIRPYGTEAIELD